MCLWNLGTELTSRWRFDMRTHLAVTSLNENQREEKILRGTRVNIRGSGATSEEQLDERRKTERIEREAPNASASSDPCAAREYLVSCEIQSRPGSVLVQQKSGHVDDDVQISALDALYEKDARELTWLRSGHVSMLSRRKFFKVILRL